MDYYVCILNLRLRTYVFLWGLLFFLFFVIFILFLLFFLILLHALFNFLFTLFIEIQNFK